MPIPTGSPLVQAILEHPEPLPLELLTALTEHLYGTDAAALAERSDLPVSLSRRLLERHLAVPNEAVSGAFAQMHAAHLAGPDLVAFLEELCDKDAAVSRIGGYTRRVMERLTPSQVMAVLDGDSLPALALIAAVGGLPETELARALLRAYDLIRQGAGERIAWSAFHDACERLGNAVDNLLGADPAAGSVVLAAAPTRLVVLRLCDGVATRADGLSNAALERLLDLSIDHVESVPLKYLPNTVREVVKKHGARLSQQFLTRVAQHPLASPTTKQAAVAALAAAPPDPALEPGAPVSRLIAEMSAASPEDWATALAIFGSTKTSPTVSDFVAVAQGVNVS